MAAARQTVDAPKPEITLELDAEGCWLMFQGEQLGVIVVDETGTGLRLILGDADIGGGAELRWHGDPISLRMDMSEGITHLLGGQR